MTVERDRTGVRKLGLFQINSKELGRKRRDQLVVWGLGGGGGLGSTLAQLEGKQKTAKLLKPRGVSSSKVRPTTFEKRGEAATHPWRKRKKPAATDSSRGEKTWQDGQLFFFSRTAISSSPNASEAKDEKKKGKLGEGLKPSGTEITKISPGRGSQDTTSRGKGTPTLVSLRSPPWGGGGGWGVWRAKLLKRGKRFLRMEPYRPGWESETTSKGGSLGWPIHLKT